MTYWLHKRIYNRWRLSDALWLFCVLCFLLPSCQREEPVPVDEMMSPATGTRMEFTLDSIFLYAKQVYLWGDVLPTYTEFNPRTRYGSVKPELSAYKTELYDISQLNINLQTGNPYESPVYAGSPKYSYLEQGSVSIPTMEKATLSDTSSDVIPVYKLIKNDNKKIAYISLTSFPELIAIKEQLDAIFHSFAKAEVTDIIVDLRSNGGGYVGTAEYVANLIASSGLTGKVMYTEAFNSLMQEGKATLLKNQLYRDANGNTINYRGRLATMADVNFSKKANTVLFEKKGILETVKQIYFIVSGHTASASELLISCMKPYFDVKLVGERTYGKPVGFFGIHIDTYTLYLSSFILQNAAGWYDYFEGMQPDRQTVLSTQATLGDLQEMGLHTALNLINDTDATGGRPNQQASIPSRKSIKKQNIPLTGGSSASGYFPIYKQHFKLK
ncbi:S41 family peptidase [Olivibacter sp. CPCC 100613]|uniref:S41 family peptidase n=1 Tax=Olivibacter sp. CPCC 100613 TaxID=3079931 RepID=UPI002FFBAC59